MMQFAASARIGAPLPQSGDSYTLRYVLALIVIAAISLFSINQVNNHLDHVKQLQKTQQLANSQVLLVNQLHSIITDTKNIYPTPPDARSIAKHHLAELILNSRSFEKITAEEYLLAHPNDSKEIEQILLNPPYNLMANMRDYLATVESFINANNTAELQRAARASGIAVTTQIMPAVAELSHRLKQNSEAEIAYVQKLQRFFFLTGLVVLLAVGLLIFRPLFSRVKATEAELRTQINAQQQTITERVAAEQKLARVLDIASDGIWEWQPDLTNQQADKLFLSPRFLGMLGYEPTEIQPTIGNWRRLIHPTDQAVFEQNLQALLTKATPLMQTSLRYKTKSGEVRHMLVRGKAELDSANQVVRVAGSQTDITAQRLAEEKNTEQKEILEIFIRSAPAAVAMLDRQQRYLQISSRWQEIFMLPDTATVISMPFHTHTPFFPQSWPAAIQDGLSGVTRSATDDLCLHTDGSEHYFNWKIQPWRDVKGFIGGVIIFAEDVTNQHQLMQSMEHARQMAEDAATAKSQFLANMSHEIRTPLNGIIGMAELLTTHDLPTQSKALLQVMQTASNNLLTIVNDVLDYAKLEAGRVTLEDKPFDLKIMLLEIWQLLNGAAVKKALELYIDYPAALPTRYLGDATRLRQIFINLVGNAIKFTHAGKVTIKVAGTPLPGSTMDLTITVQDTGIGIPAEKLAMIFDKFTQADPSTTRKYGGTGLGLSICKELVTLMGGTIDVSSTVNEGSIFTIRLKLVEALL